MENSISKWIYSSLIVFLSLVIFGGVDFYTQGVLLIVLGLGVRARPLRGDLFPFYLRMLIVLFLVLLVGKELLPASWFPRTIWREAVEGDFGVVLRGNHHPELMRFFEVLFSGLGIGILYAWWRSFSETRTLRIHLAWTGFIAAVVIAALSFLLRDPAIFKMRTMLGYDGFGPFPNRNHTGAFLMVGLFLGWGCAWESMRHRLTVQWISVLFGMGILIAALVISNSRGAIVSGGIVFIFLMTMIFLRRGDFRFLIIGAGFMIISGSLFCVSGSPLLKRFRGEIRLENAFSGRVEIWKDAVEVIKDAPWFGHGVGMYEKIVPFYQVFEKPNHQVHHPENAYLQLISECGVPLFLLGVIILVLMTMPAWDERGSHHQFPLRVCAFGGFLTYALQGMVDLPFLRWGNAVMMTLCLAIFTVSKLPSHEERQGWKRMDFSLPVLIGLFLIWNAWSMGNGWGEPSFATSSREQLQAGVRRDPLNGVLHHYLGMRLVVDPVTRDEGYREFQLSHRLLPSVWTYPVEAARAVAPYSEGISLSFWSTGIERAGHRGAEIFKVAMQLTKEMPRGKVFWRRFAEVHPEWIPSYLVQEKSLEGDSLLSVWMEERGGRRVAELGIDERRDFYEAVGFFKSREIWERWIKGQEGEKVENERGEFVSWAWVYQQLGEMEKAWGYLERTLVPFEFLLDGDVKEEGMRAEWNQNREDWVNARRWVCWLHRNQRIEERDQVLMEVAGNVKSPEWFRQMAAHLLAEKKDYAGAVAMGLR